ncbi:MAG: TlpA disulfide reductase family protein, partial [Planctomycetota bacterium]|nr:TlpA disulfide reductase family protein [Planctomycetota bacterium]
MTQFPNVSLRKLLLKLSLCLLVIASASQLQSAELLTYSGQMIGEKGDPVATTKRFTLAAVRDVSAQGGTLHWIVVEDGRGALPWPHSYGSSQWLDGNGLNVQAATASRNNPQLLYKNEELNAYVAVALPQLADGQKLNQESIWKQGPVTYRVTERQTVEGQESWRVLGFTNFGVKRTFWVNDQGYIVRLRENVTIGRGDRFDLEYDLKNVETLDDEDRGKVVTAFDVFNKFRTKVEIEKLEKEIVWDDEQLEVFREDIDRLVSVSAGTPLSAVARLAQEDLKTQKGRSGGVATLMTRAIGKVVEEPGFELYRGSDYSDESLTGNVTVLHFWEYRSSPLEQPYGQVGYLDFLYRKYKEQGLNVFGVVSNTLLEDPAERSRVRVNARKFASFMNLSFPIVADVKGSIGKIGDPREAGAKLPLFIVLDQKGRIVHYKAGFYEIDRDLGLK